MKEETHEKPKNQFQLELEAKMRERRARGLTTALSPSPTDMNQDSIVISDDEDGMLFSEVLRWSKDFSLFHIYFLYSVNFLFVNFNVTF